MNANDRRLRINELLAPPRTTPEPMPRSNRCWNFCRVVSRVRPTAGRCGYDGTVGKQALLQLRRCPRHARPTRTRGIQLRPKVLGSRPGGCRRSRHRPAAARAVSALTAIATSNSPATGLEGLAGCRHCRRRVGSTKVATTARARFRRHRERPRPACRHASSGASSGRGHAFGEHRAPSHHEGAEHEAVKKPRESLTTMAACPKRCLRKSINRGGHRLVAGALRGISRQAYLVTGEKKCAI